MHFVWKWVGWQIIACGLCDTLKLAGANCGDALKASVDHRDAGACVGLGLACGNLGHSAAHVGKYLEER